uniref:Putative secreted protein n=1 Tax=Anopheles darlingi TaxID=43151 RepID=A0A2M4D7R2_ANODA
MIVTYVMRTLFVGGVLGVSLMSIIHALNWRSLATLFQKLHQLDMKVNTAHSLFKCCNYVLDELSNSLFPSFNFSNIP